MFGCLSDYTWCDVALPGVRGWIDAQLIDYPYQGGYAPLLEYGAIIGVPITGFAIGAYWDRYYRHRPWFHDRDRWEHRAEPRLGPGGVPPGQGCRWAAAGAGGPPPVHDARPSAARRWNGAIRTPPPTAPAPAPAPRAPAPMPGAAGNPRPAAPPPAVMHPPPAAVMRPPPAPGGGAVRCRYRCTRVVGGGGGYGARDRRVVGTAAEATVAAAAAEEFRH